MFSTRFDKLLGRTIPPTAALALAVGAMPSAANAAVTACQASVADNGGSSPSNPDYVGTLCGGSTINFVNNTLPAYWEFTWGDPAPASDISSVGTFGPAYLLSSNPFGNLELLTASGKPPASVATSLIASAAYSPPTVSTVGYLYLGTTTADLGAQALVTGTTYEVGITASNNVADPSGSISFKAIGVPEPASLTLLGTALAGIAAFRRRRKQRS